MNIHVKPKRTRNRKPKPDALRTIHGAHHNAPAPLLRLMTVIAHDRQGFIGRLRDRFNALDGGEILVGWHLVDRGFFERGHEVHSLLDGNSPLSYQIVEVMLDFIGDTPETYLA